MACAVATSCCIRDVSSQWEGQNFDPPLLPHFQPILIKLKNKKNIKAVFLKLYQAVSGSVFMKQSVVEF